ncbi:hypothetical protein [Aquimarina sp. I32.4]|uniref:hypothetical protein n=1 Tax=Aquimarina sp. I32.4 TaxID=2053903 RepID=UPI000CDE9A29|nr:hypothetical protein [Aquimarina sp. I32.4]
MKIRKSVFFLTLILTINYSIAQSINDTIFTNVVLIQKEDIVQDNNDYLIDVIMDFDFKKTPIIFNNSRLSKSFFINKLFKDKPIILITPDWKFYEKVVEEAQRMGGCIEPATTNIFYQRKYLKNISKVDSVQISGNQPKMVFNSRVKGLKTDDTIIFYYTESYGSMCCPIDPKWKVKEKLDNFITSFEATNNIKLGDAYVKITGKEGEHIVYFTLSNLSKKQKLAFLQGVRGGIYFKNADRKYIEINPQIFTPRSIQKEGLKLVPRL